MNAPVRPAEITPKAVPVTAAALQALADTGYFDGDPNSYELIDGSIVMTPPPGTDHHFVEERAMKALYTALIKAGLNESWTVVAGGALSIAEDQLLVPDVIVSRSRTEPRPLVAEDIGVLIEIAWSSRTFDLGTKAALYARAGIADYWVLDIPARTVIVHREPVDGAYTRVTPVTDTETLAALSPAGLSCAVADFF